MENSQVVHAEISVAEPQPPLQVLMNRWDVGEYFKKFEEEGITIDILGALVKDSETLQALIPKIGKRFLLKKRVEEHFQTQFLLPTEKNAGSEFSVSSEVQSVCESDITHDISNTILFNSTAIENVPPLLVLQPSALSTPIAKERFDILAEQPLEEPSDEPRAKKPKSLNNFLINFDLKKTLQSYAIGKALLNWYSVKGNFDSARQGYLVDIIVSEFLNNGYTHLSSSDYDLLSRKIVELFPCEIVEAYYLPPIKKKDSIINKPGLAKGKLVDKFRNKLTFLREAGILPSRHSDAQPDKFSEDLTEDNSYDNNVLWLRHNREPTADVYDHWDQTFPVRRQKLLHEGGDCKEIFIEYPILEETIGIALIERDFEKIYPGKSSLFSNWEPVVMKLISLRKQYITLDTDKVLLDLLQSTDTLDDNYKTFLMFSLLPSLLPNRSRHLYGKNRKHWKPTIADSRNGIVLRVDLAGDIESVIKNKEEKLSALEIPVQPHVIVEIHGTKVQEVYVFIHGHLHKVSTVLKAIDICFKAYHAFHLKYQVESEHIWLFIQHSMYNIKTKWDSPIPNILDIVNKTKIPQ